MRTWLLPLAVLLAIPFCPSSATGDEQATTRRLWDDAFRRKRAPASGDREDRGATYLGVTVWRLRPVTAEEETGGDWRAERAGADTRFVDGEQVRIGVESAHSGYLYVFDAEEYADGGRSAPRLVFPTTRTRGGDNRVLPGRLVEIPDRQDTPPFFSIRRSRPDHVADVLTLLVTPQPLPDIRPGREQQSVTPEQFAQWERAWGAPSSRLELPDGAGRTRTPAERDAASAGKRLLSHDDPVPQTLFRIDAPAIGGVLVHFPLGMGARESFEGARARCRTLIERNAFPEALAAAQNLEQQALAAGESGALDLARARVLIARTHESLSRYAEARALYETSLAVHEQALGTDHPEVAALLDALARLSSRQGRYAEAAELALRALTIREKAFGREHLACAESLLTLGDVMRRMDQLEEAEQHLRRGLELRERELGPEHPEVARALDAVAVLLTTQDQAQAAKDLLLRAVAINTKAYGHAHLSIADDFNSLGNIEARAANFAEAESYYRRSLEIREQILGPEHPRVADSLNNLAIVYSDLGREAEVEQALRRSLSIREKALGPEHTDVAASLNNLGVYYYDLCRYAEAEQVYRRSLAIREKAFGPEHSEVGTSLTNLGNVFARQGKAPEAAAFRRRAQAIQEKAFGASHPETARTLNNLALSELALARPAEGEALLRRAQTIWEKALGERHPYVGVGLRNLGLACAEQQRLTEAQSLLERSVEVLEGAWGHDHGETQLSRFELAKVHLRQRRFAEAEPLLRDCLETGQRVLAPDHVYLGDSLLGLAGLFFATGRMPEAAEFFARSVEVLRRQFDYHFSYMSEADRLTFLSTIEDFFPQYFSFCLRDRARDPAALERFYDVVLWHKGFVGGSLAIWRRRLAAGSDPDTSRLLDQLAGRKTRLAGLLMAGPFDAQAARRQAETLAHEIQELEGTLVRRSSATVAAPALGRDSWRDVQRALGPSEAAVELVRFRDNDGVDWTGRNRYVALVVTAQSERPALVELGEAEEIEGRVLSDHDRLAHETAGRRLEHPPAAAGPTTLAYERIVRPVAQAAPDAARLFLSPDGLLNRVAWNAIPLPDGRRLLDRFEVRLLSNTKDLVGARPPALATTAVLVGNPAFELETPVGSSAPVDSSAPDRTPVERRLSSELRSSRAWSVTPLPFTETEVSAIRSRLEQKDWKVEVLSGASALEGAVKAVRGPRLLHLATHGFFLPDQRQGESTATTAPTLEDPLLRSGVLLAGAARGLAGTTPDGAEDGILTAYEAATLDLQGTELVTLSACETALGDIHNGEGVFGLRRSFQVAGAGAVLMSLWAVPDRETQELMTLFYDGWLAGHDKHEALRQAQRTLRDRVRERYGRDLPYYWGGFVLVGV